jgi:hypothetical protein
MQIHAPHFDQWFRTLPLILRLKMVAPTIPVIITEYSGDFRSIPLFGNLSVFVYTVSGNPGTCEVQTAFGHSRGVAQTDPFPCYGWFRWPPTQ